MNPSFLGINIFALLGLSLIEFCFIFYTWVCLTQICNREWLNRISLFYTSFKKLSGGAVNTADSNYDRIKSGYYLKVLKLLRTDGYFATRQIVSKSYFFNPSNVQFAGESRAVFKSPLFTIVNRRMNAIIIHLNLPDISAHGMLPHYSRY